MAGRIAAILKGFPRVGETFVAQEIAALEARGLEFVIVAVGPPTGGLVHPVQRRIRAPVLQLPTSLVRELPRVVRAWRAARRRPGYPGARTLWLRDLRREPRPSRVRRFAQALVLAAELPDGTQGLYAHFLQPPGAVGRYAASLTGLPLSVSAHAKDIWTTPERAKRDVLAACRWAVTCTGQGLDHLRRLAPATPIELVRHGLDAARFPPYERAPGPDGADASRPVRLLGVARAVPKKGIETVLEALALLPPHLAWRYEHIGGGTLQGRLERQAQALGLADRVDWRGLLPQDQVLEAYRRADLFVLASRIAPDGDRDGLPNVLLEALSQALAVVASRVSAIPELVLDGRTGRLVPPEDPRTLATVLEALIADPEERLRLGRGGRERVQREFAMQPGIERLAALLGQAAR